MGVFCVSSEGCWRPSAIGFCDIKFGFWGCCLIVDWGWLLYVCAFRDKRSRKERREKGKEKPTRNHASSSGEPHQLPAPDLFLFIRIHLPCLSSFPSLL